MSVLLFFNELSNSVPVPPRSADQAMTGFVDLLRAVRRLRSDTALVTAVPLASMELAPGYTVQQWIAADGANRDRWRFLRAIQNRAPYRSVVPDRADAGVEYRHDGEHAAGIGAAHLLDGLVVSLLLRPAWDDPWVTAERKMLVEGDHGEVMFREDTVRVRHAAHHEHARRHESWIRQAGQDGLTSGAAVWEHKAAFFPHLSFLPRVEGDLRGLRPDWVRPVVNVLLKIESSIAAWHGGGTALPEWQTKITEEFEQRERLCRFPDLDGVTRVFELHARFTPGPGRLHFRLVTEDRTARVAYIGRKLGT